MCEKNLRITRKGGDERSSRGGHKSSEHLQGICDSRVTEIVRGAALTRLMHLQEHKDAASEKD
jgi:hypothetical protein